MEPVKAKPRKKLLGEVGGYWGKQGFGGYPGLKFTAEEIVPYIPIKPLYVEPFAGLGRTSELIKKYDHMILNDMSDYAIGQLEKKFKLWNNIHITKFIFDYCIFIFDSPHTVFLIDPPWVTTVYTENSLTFCDRPALQYYDELIKDILPKVLGDWVLCGPAEGSPVKRMRESGYPTLEVQSRKPSIFGQYARTLLISNKEFKRHREVNYSIESWL